MSEGFKNWGSAICILGIIGFFIGLIGQFTVLLWISLVAMISSILFFISGAFCKILEESRDSLKRIEEILQQESKTE